MPKIIIEPGSGGSSAQRGLRIRNFQRAGLQFPYFRNMASLLR
jgi:hypothetical protein